MSLLIYLYDNSLIYYPNVFFPLLFLLSILGIILVSIGIIILGKQIRRVIKEIKSNLRQKKRIKKEKKTSFIQAVLFLIIFFVHMIKVIFIKINTMLEYIEFKVEKIVKKIGKEILIKE